MKMEIVIIRSRNKGTPNNKNKKKKVLNFFFKFVFSTGFFFGCLDTNGLTVGKSKVLV